MGKAETAQERTSTVGRITMKRVIGVTDDGSDFIVADTKTIRYIAFAVSMKIYSLIRQVVHGLEV